MTILNPNGINTVGYYSFYTGKLGTLKHTWALDDVKIPAVNVRQALIFHFNTCHPHKKQIIIPTAFMISQTYRLIIEFERVSVRGLTVMQYRQVRAHTVFSALQGF